MVRNGYLPERQLQTGIGPVTVKIPKVRAKTGEPVTFRSAVVPPYVRKTRTLEAALPWLFLKGVSSGEMGEALPVLVGPEAEGLSASTVLRLKQVWAQEYQTWSTARLDRDRWVVVWADGVYSGLRAEQTKLCALVVIGVNERGEKHFLSIEDGVRESTQSWREVLLKQKSRGMNAPHLHQRAHRGAGPRPVPGFAEGGTTALADDRPRRGDARGRVHCRPASPGYSAPADAAVLPPHVNGKQENLWGRVEGRLLRRCRTSLPMSPSAIVSSGLFKPSTIP